MELLLTLTGVLPAWFTAISAIVTASTAITALTPTKVDDKLIGGLGKGLNIGLRVLNMLSGNILMNKNQDDK